MAGVVVGGPPRSRWDTPPIGGTNNPTASFGNPNTFTSAANTQAKDYDRIMGLYGDIYNKGNSSPLNYTNISPSTSNYQESARQDKALSDLSELSSTGGYSDAGIAALRERGVSPIRSVFSTAQRNIDRARGLSGGYSPNYGAVTAKLAREQASEIGTAMNNVNAGIAQNVASNRISAAPAFASAANTESGLRNQSLTHNADVINQINEFNATNRLDAQKTQRTNQLGAVEGMKSLYGTTPALTNTFGNQVVQAAQLGQGQQEINNRQQAGVNAGILGSRFRNG